MTSSVRDIAYRPSPSLKPATPKRRRLRLDLTLSVLAVLIVGVVVAYTMYRPEHVTTYTVRPGDTEYSIAIRFDPMTDPRKVIAWMERKNGLQDGRIYPGQRITIPVQGSG